jgi:hypothetical protein
MSPKSEIKNLKSLLQECIECVEKEIKNELLGGDYRKARRLQDLRLEILKSIS